MSSSVLAALDHYLQAQAGAFEDSLCELLRIPSVSTDSRHKQDVRKAGEWINALFGKLGFQTQLVDTPGHPIVYAKSPHVSGRPTVMVYGHYDVQPPDPENLWETPPFAPTLRNGNLYARGATDDKGQMLTHVLSTQAWMAVHKALPINLIYVIEGEEEIGSKNLESFLQSRRQELKCDCAVISDTSQFAPGVPAITYGLRGLVYFELRLQGAAEDKHSGVFGGAVVNPAIVLSKILASMIDGQGRIQVPGFYDDVAALSPQERQQFAELPFTDAAFCKKIGVKAVDGEVGFTTLERRWARPTFDIHGLTSGYQGEGAKTVLPCKASGKFSFRLVPKQDPAKITAAVKAYVEKQIVPGITNWELITGHGAPGVVVPLDSPYLQAAKRAIADGFGREPVFMREGGSIPVVSTFKDLLGVDTLLLGWGQDDDNLHAPNEKFSLADFHRGIKASCHLWQYLSEVQA